MFKTRFYNISKIYIIYYDREYHLFNKKFRKYKLFTIHREFLKALK